MASIEFGSALLDLKTIAFLTQAIDIGTRCLLLKFGENCFIDAEIINIFLKSKMAATAILDFSINLHI